MNPSWIVDTSDKTDQRVMTDIETYGLRAAEFALLRGDANEALQIAARVGFFAADPNKAHALRQAAATMRDDAVAQLAHLVSTAAMKGDAASHARVADAQRAAGDIGAAAEAYLRAARLASSEPSHFIHFCWCMIKLGRLDAARKTLNGLIGLKVMDATILAGVAAVALGSDDKAGAARAAGAALQMSPNAALYLPFGPAFEAMPGDPAAALERGQLLETAAQSLHIQSALAAIDRRDYDAALVALDEVLTIIPEDETALTHKAIALSALKRNSEALDVQMKVAQVARDGSRSLERIVHRLIDLRAFEEAVATARNILALDPQLQRIRWRGIYAALRVSDWNAVDDFRAGITEELTTETSAPPFDLIATEEDPAFLARNAIAFAQGYRIAEEWPAPTTRPPRPGERIRLAWYSNDLQTHATVRLLAEVLELIDRDRFETFAYSYGENDQSADRARVMAAVDHFIDTSGLSNAELVQRARADGIHVFVDLKGWTAFSRAQVLIGRPAPIQVNWLGFPGTYGIPETDYIIADPFLIPPGAEGWYTEAVVRLPDTYQPNDRQRVVAPAPTRAESGLPEGAFVFGSLNQTYKITRAVFAGWLRILEATPGSVLWLIDTNGYATHRLRQAAGPLADRLIFASVAPNAEHLARYHLIDLCLDTFPCGSHTTASDGLWVGAPLVTRAGDTFASRVAGSLLHAVGLPDLVTTSQEAYEALAIALAHDPERLRHIRARLAANRLTTPLFDTPRFAAALGAAFERMVAIWAAGRVPEPFDV